MKKITGFILLTCFIFTMAACGDKTSQPVSSNEPPAVSNSTPEEKSESNAVKEGEQEDTPKETTSVQYKIGDVVFSNGAVRSMEEITELESDNAPIAVIAGYREDGTAFGIGVHRSETTLQWASDDSAGYAIKFEDTVCVQKSDLDFSGDTDGSDNWAVMGAKDEPGTASAEANYPAFHFASTYGLSHDMAPDYASGWYLPSIAELCTIYRNRDTVNSSLHHLYGLDSHAAMDGLATNWYWSSSQAASEDDYAWFVHYFNGYAGECPKNFTNVHALAVRVF